MVLKKEQPFRSDKAINRILKREFGRQLPRSTLYRHLRQQGATRWELGVSKEIVTLPLDAGSARRPVGRRFRARPAGDAPGSVREDPSFRLDRLPQPLHRRGPVLRPREPGHPAGFAVAGLGNHGASRELYVDNAKIYHAKALQLACTQLNIQLLHRPPRDPPAGGLIERFFQTCQMQLEAEVLAGHILHARRLKPRLGGRPAGWPITKM